MATRRATQAAGMLVVAAFSAGCIDLQQTLNIERDLSGTAGFAVRINLDPVVYFMAKLERGFSGKEGEPTPAEIEKARQEMMRDSPAQLPDDFEAEKKAMAAALPPGLRLVDATATAEGLRFGANVTFGFDRLSRLTEVAVPASTTGAAAGGRGGRGPGTRSKRGGPFDEPFGDLRVTDDGTLLGVKMPVQNPMTDSPFPMGGAAGGKAPDAETVKEVQQLLGGLRVGISITAPFEVVAHTAHRRDGQTLVWEYDWKKIIAASPAELNRAVKVVYRK